MPYLVLVSLVWGLSFVIIKGALTPLDSNFVSLVRMVLSLLVFLPFLRPSGVRLPDRLRLAAIGGVQFGLMYVAYVACFRHIPAHVVALLTTTTPIFVTLFHDLLNREFHAKPLLAAALAVAGGVVIKLPEDALHSGLVGVALLQLSNVAFAWGQVAYKRFMDARPGLRDRDVFGILYGGAVVVTAAFFLAGALRPGATPPAVSPTQWLALAYLGFVASGICFFLWNLGGRKVGAGTLAVMNNLKIPVGVLAGLVFLKEATDYRRLVAGCLLFGAALWVNSRVKSAKRPA
ncbi:MAG: EamA family transporter [Acidobacteriota bacterium]|nr:EamA family transporter [Acidobacteriota bacterium]